MPRVGRPFLTLMVLVLAFSAGCHLVFKYQDRTPDAGATDLPKKKDGKVVKKDGKVVKKDGPVAKKDGPTAKKDGPTVKKDGPGPPKDKAVTPDKMVCPSGQCSINGKCYASGTTKGTCLKCDPTKSPTAWSVKGATGCVYTLLGTAGPGDTDGPLSKAHIMGPYGIAVDQNGTIYVSDSSKNKIRKISGDQVTTLAGSGSSGKTNGPGATAEFDKPSGIALDTNGNLYVADTGNNRIRKVTPGGVVSNIGSVSVLDEPTGLTVTNTGDIYVADTGHHVIRKLTQTGTYSIIAGKKGTSGKLDGPNVVATLYEPTNIKVGYGSGSANDNLHLVVTELGNHDLRRVSIIPPNIITVKRIAGTGGIGTDNGSPPTAAKFRNPYGLAGLKLSKSGNMLGTNGYVMDTYNHCIRSVNNSKVGDATGVKGSTTFGFNDGAAGTAKFWRPYMGAMIGKQIFITDFSNSRVRVLVLP